MKIFSLAFLLLFLYPFVFPITDSQQKLNKNKSGVANIVFKSTDGGQSWQDISEGLPGDKLEGSLFVNDRGFYLRTGNYIYHNKPNNKAPFWEKEIFPDDHSNIAPGKSGIFAYDYHQGQFRQKINGSSEWSPIYENLQLKGIIDVFETAGGTVFIVCDRGRGLFRSTNNGKNWKEVSRGVWKLVESNGVLMANSINGIIRSTDDGENWALVISEGGLGIDVQRIRGGFAAITFNTRSNSRRVRTSYDGGKSWQPADSSLQVQSSNVPLYKPFSQVDPPESIWHPINTGLPEQAFITSIVQVGNYFFGGQSTGIFRSSDKGKTWKLILPSIKGKVFNLFVSGNVIYAIPRSVGC